MAIRRLYNGKYQASVLGEQGRRITRVFRTRREAENQERLWKQEKENGLLGGSSERNRTLDSYFNEWFENICAETPEHEQTGWRKSQAQLYRDYIGPVIGRCKLKSITPQMVKQVLSGMASKGKSQQTRRHVYNLLRKMFNDAIENYCYMTFNPALRKLKPKIPQKETNHLRHLDQVKRLLAHVDDKPFGLAIWTQMYLGLRIGELQALTWDDIDLDAGKLLVRRTFVRKTCQFRDYPKGGKQHAVNLPPELWERLIQAKVRTNGEYVATSHTGGILQYKPYLKTLKAYCKEVEVPLIGTHGLRHTTWELYRNHGATKDDMQRLFAHSSGRVTERYLHGTGTNLEKVAKVIRLFDKKNAQPSASRISATDSAQKMRKNALGSKLVEEATVGSC